MTEPTIICPACKVEIKLTDSLAAPLIESTRREFEQRLARKDADFIKREYALREREATLAKARETVDDEVAKKLQTERAAIAAEEEKRARRVLSVDLEKKTKEIADLENVLKQHEMKLVEAQRDQVEVLRKQRELDEARREFDLTIEKRIREERATVRDQAKKEAEESLNFKVKEQEQIIAAMQTQIGDLKRRAEQGSQQLQGEVQELELEELLRTEFPRDTIRPVPKGEHGGDIVQEVIGASGRACGTILWESKRTRHWSDGWLAKLRGDQRAARADLAVIVSQALPKNVETFDRIDDVCVTHLRTVLPVATILRQMLIEIAGARQSSEGQQTKMEMVYRYLTGSQFRQRVEAIVEAFSSMRDELEKEKKTITKQWAKREMQITRVMEATVGMYGDLQGIAGKTLQEVEGLEWQALNPPTAAGDESD